MNMKLELVAVPVTDVDRAKAFYVNQVGFHEDHDHQVGAAGNHRRVGTRCHYLHITQRIHWIAPSR